MVLSVISFYSPMQTHTGMHFLAPVGQFDMYIIEIFIIEETKRSLGRTVSTQIWFCSTKWCGFFFFFPAALLDETASACHYSLVASSYEAN